MNIEIYEKITESIKKNVPVAVVTVTAAVGSSPASLGSVMAVWGNGEIVGTIGGGNIEHAVIRRAGEFLTSGKSGSLIFDLSSDGDIGMACGGNVEVFIKVEGVSDNLVVVGGGHIGKRLSQLGAMAGFRVTVVDDRDEYVSNDRFPEASLVVSGKLSEVLGEMRVNKNTYVTIATRSHECDEEALKAVVGKGFAYIGMIGSSKKIKKIFANLLGQGVAKDELGKVYAPMGLNIASVKLEEIAFSIMSEIMLVKNNGTPEHMKAVKNISF
jgi:xanthine dehydrogenase accessory factor